MVDLIEIVAEEWVLFLELLVVEPLPKRLVNVGTADIEHGFGISASSLLQAPRGGVVEIEAASAWTRVSLLEVVAHVDTWICLSLCEQSIASIVVVMDAP